MREGLLKTFLLIVSSVSCCLQLNREVRCLLVILKVILFKQRDLLLCMADFGDLSNIVRMDLILNFLPLGLLSVLAIHHFNQIHQLVPRLLCNSWLFLLFNRHIISHFHIFLHSSRKSRFCLFLLFSIGLLLFNLSVGLQNLRNRLQFIHDGL